MSTQPESVSDMRVQKSGDMTSIVILVILLWIVFRTLFYHHDSGILKETGENDLYVNVSNGHMYNASACKKVSDRGLGNYVVFTAIGIDLSLNHQQMIMPVIIRCEFGWWADELKPLP
jgi:hypothetical protein